MASLLDELKAADDAYLAAIANKGLANRALREAGSASPALEFEHDTLLADFDTGEHVEIAGSIANAACSCPSRSVCKHILIAIVAFRSFGAEAGQDQSAQQKPSFQWLADISASALKKAAGKAVYEQAAEIALSEPSQISEHDILAIGIAQEHVTFLPASTIDAAVCSCKAKGICKHKIAAALSYIMAKQGALPKEFAPEEKKESAAKPADAKALDQARRLAEEILATGLARMPGDIASRCSEIGSLARSAKLAALDRGFSRLEGMFSAYMRKSSAFSSLLLINEVCAILENIEQLESGGMAYAGAFRDEYSDIGSLEAYGLGCSGWESDSGYAGVSAIFYSPSMQKVYRYSASMPKTTGATPLKMYKGTAPWDLPTSLGSLASTKVRLTNAKATLSGSLSASKETKAEILGKSSLAGKELAGITFSEFGGACEYLWPSFEAGERAYLILKPEKIGEADFNEISQTLTAPLIGSDGVRIWLTAAHTSGSKLIESLYALTESLAGKSPGLFLAECYLGEGMVMARPVSHFLTEHLNITLDPPVALAKKSKFKWGF
ncbi:MAG: SWIM zinc finger family protein [Eubacteriaceae bacterium]|nr:SWIM zinc finger family protein [Eubacteriaceae bacterium]